MPYLITTLDKPGHEAVRDRLRAEHLAYMEANVDKVIAGGGFFNDASTSVLGGMILLDVATRTEAEAFLDKDPFMHADLFERVEIRRWRAAFFDYKRVLPPAQQTAKGTP
jgi:hypothetical protein